MADTIRATVHSLKEVRQDLDSVSLGLSRAITAMLRDNAQIVAGRTATLVDRGPGPRGPRDPLPHIADTIGAQVTGTSMLITSEHPAAPVFEWAGQGQATIAPRGVPITITRRAWAHKAGEQTLDRIERDLTSRIDDLIRAHGL